MIYMTIFSKSKSNKSPIKLHDSVTCVLFVVKWPACIGYVTSQESVANLISKFHIFSVMFKLKKNRTNNKTKRKVGTPCNTAWATLVTLTLGLSELELSEDYIDNKWMHQFSNFQLNIIFLKHNQSVWDFVFVCFFCWKLLELVK